MTYIVEIKNYRGWVEDSEHLDRASALAVIAECREDSTPARLGACHYEVREFAPDGHGEIDQRIARNSDHDTLESAREEIVRMGGCDPFDAQWDDAAEAWCDGKDEGCGGWNIYRVVEEG